MRIFFPDSLGWKETSDTDTPAPLSRCMISQTELPSSIPPSGLRCECRESIENFLQRLWGFYDFKSRTSFGLQDVRSERGSDVVIILVGNKTALTVCFLIHTSFSSNLHVHRSMTCRIIQERRISIYIYYIIYVYINAEGLDVFYRKEVQNNRCTACRLVRVHSFPCPVLSLICGSACRNEGLT